MKQSVVLYNTQQAEKDKESYQSEILKGLSLVKKQIPFKFNYDEEGSDLCAKIQQSKEYYLWACDKNLLINQGSDMLKLMSRDKFNLIDLGAGDATKTQYLIQIALKEGYKFEYIPLDISYHSNMLVMESFKKKFPNLDMTVLTAQYEEGIKWIQQNKLQKNVYLFVGSTFGNNTNEQNIKFCQMINQNLKEGDQLFIGFDLWKNPEIITRAYLDNPYQRAFLLNNLKRMNKELGANFDLQKFYSYAYFEPDRKCIRGLLISAEEQQIEVSGHKFKFAKAQSIEMYESRKWIIEDLVYLFKTTSLKQIKTFIDDKQYFAYVAFEKRSE